MTTSVRMSTTTSPIEAINNHGVWQKNLNNLNNLNFEFSYINDDSFNSIIRNERSGSSEYQKMTI